MKLGRLAQRMAEMVATSVETAQLSAVQSASLQPIPAASSAARSISQLIKVVDGMPHESSAVKADGWVVRQPFVTTSTRQHETPRTANEHPRSSGAVAQHRCRSAPYPDSFRFMAVIADLTVRGLSQLDVPVVITADERSGFPVISVGRRVTSEQVAVALDEE